MSTVLPSASSTIVTAHEDHTNAPGSEYQPPDSQKDGFCSRFRIFFGRKHRVQIREQGLERLSHTTIRSFASTKQQPCIHARLCAGSTRLPEQSLKHGCPPWSNEFSPTSPELTE